MIGQESQCPSCQNFDWKSRGGPKCKAFPNGVPGEIFKGWADHRYPYVGDQGLRYEPNDEESRRRIEEIFGPLNPKRL